MMSIEITFTLAFPFHFQFHGQLQWRWISFSLFDLLLTFTLHPIANLHCLPCRLPSRLLSVNMQTDGSPSSSRGWIVKVGRGRERNRAHDPV